MWRQRGYLRPGMSFSWAWNRGGEPTGSIGVWIKGAESLMLQYMAGSEGERRDASQTIRLAHTPCHYGSTRPWFVCPLCQRRAGLLYLRWGRFACRKCQRVAYTSQSCDLMDRMWRKQAKIEARLGENWQRPKGMRQRTHEALIEAISQCEERRDEACAILLTKLMAKR